MASQQLKTAQTFLDGFADLSVEKHMSVRSENCEHIFAPASLGMGPKDNAAFAAHLERLRLLIARFPVTAKEMIESDGAVTVWATSEAHFHDDLKDDSLPAEEWIYRGEYIFMLHMDKSGRQIHRIVEFLDSKKTERVQALIAKVRANREKKL